ncbi:MAG TPA: hypothetical protein VGQ29_09700 [Gemmatimonadales bacterium]|jgi:hypothetical protein|nr:hypothetical protein [Gemmatimonadales bacterium]
MHPRAFAALAALRLAASVYAAGAVPVRDSAVPPRTPVFDDVWSGLERTTITKNPQRDELVLELPAVDLPAGMVVDEAASVGEFPVTGSIYALHAEVVDEHGTRLPNELLHHMNVMNPGERELFLPISRRILASGRETGEIRFPWLLFGARIQRGERILANAMVHNPTPVSYHGVRVRLVLSYVPEHRPWPLFSVLPWQLDVAFPVGDKSFDLPPGRSERSYEGSPAVSGKLVVIGGHMHDYGRTIEFWDVTTGKLLWHGEPAPASPGKPRAVPMAKLYGLTGIGLRITPTHRYRVRAVYDNPTGHTIPNGGMGVVGGIFMPDRAAVWPATDPSDSLYQKDLRHFMGPVGKVAVAMPMSQMHMEH